MNRKAMQLVFVCLLFVSNAFAQSQDVPKYEVGVEFTTLERGQFGSKSAEPGVGARFTYNLNETFAFEAAGYLFPDRCSGCLNGGRMHQIVAGVKAGKRFEKWGFFAKARPGVVSFSQGKSEVVSIPPGGPFPFELVASRTNHFAVDVGGVVEFYPTRRIVTRFDVGDTIIHFGQRLRTLGGFDPVTGVPQFFIFTQPARTTHNFQFNAGVGFRF